VRMSKELLPMMPVCPFTQAEEEEPEPRQFVRCSLFPIQLSKNKRPGGVPGLVMSRKSLRSRWAEEYGLHLFDGLLLHLWIGGPILGLRCVGTAAPRLVDLGEGLACVRYVHEGTLDSIAVRHDLWPQFRAIILQRDGVVFRTQDARLALLLAAKGQGVHGLVEEALHVVLGEIKTIHPVQARPVGEFLRLGDHFKRENVLFLIAEHLGVAELLCLPHPQGEGALDDSVVKLHRQDHAGLLPCRSLRLGLGCIVLFFGEHLGSRAGKEEAHKDSKNGGAFRNCSGFHYEFLVSCLGIAASGLIT